LFAYGIFKVIYSPREAFKKMAEKPQYIGPILILILYVIAQIGGTYAFFTKTYYEETIPQLFWNYETDICIDPWTDNSTLWEPYGQCTLNSATKVYGNFSIEHTKNASKIWMQLRFPETINCSGPDNPKNLSLRIMWARLDDENPKNATIYLNSTTNDFFVLDITENLTQHGQNKWINLTIPIGKEKGWGKVSDPTWGKIVSIRMVLDWYNVSQTTLRIDGLFFHGFYIAGINRIPTVTLILNPITYFILFWVVLGIFIAIFAKLIGAKFTWKILFIMAGYVLIILFVKMLVQTVLIAGTFPQLRFPTDVIYPASSEIESAKETLARIYTQAGLALTAMTWLFIPFYIWGCFLCAIGLRSILDFEWQKALLVSLPAFIVSVLIMMLLFLGYLPVFF